MGSTNEGVRKDFVRHRDVPRVETFRRVTSEMGHICLMIKGLPALSFVDSDEAVVVKEDV